MNGWVVADSRIFLATVLPEQYSTQAIKLISLWTNQQIQVAAPVLFRYEVISVIRKSVHRGILTAQDGTNQRDVLLSQSIHFMLDDDLLRRGYELATKYNRPSAYDAQYLAVAERLNCEFWTTDERLYNTLTQDLSWVKWLGNFVV